MPSGRVERPAVGIAAADLEPPAVAPDAGGAFLDLVVVVAAKVAEVARVISPAVTPADDVVDDDALARTAAHLAPTAGAAPNDRPQRPPCRRAVERIAGHGAPGVSSGYSGVCGCRIGRDARGATLT